MLTLREIARKNTGRAMPPQRKSIDVELYNSHKNESILGVLTVETVTNGGGASGNWSGGGGPSTLDPQGAAMYVIVVILVYGLSIVFLIGSHVFYKRKQERLENDNERLVSKYLEEAPVLRERSARESFKKLKRSLVPMLAESNAKDLLFKSSKNRSYICLLGDNPAVSGHRAASPGKVLPAVTFKPNSDTAQAARSLESILQPGQSSPARQAKVTTNFANIAKMADKGMSQNSGKLRDPAVVAVVSSPTWGATCPNCSQFHPCPSGDRGQPCITCHGLVSTSVETDSLTDDQTTDVPSTHMTVVETHLPYPDTGQSENPIHQHRLSGTFLEVPPYPGLVPSLGKDDIDIIKDPIASIFVKTASTIIPPTLSKDVSAKIRDKNTQK